MSKDEFETMDEFENEKKSSKGKMNVMSMVMIIIGVVCIGVSIYGLVGIFSEYKKAVDTYQSAEEEFVTPYLPNTETEEPSTENLTESTEITEETEGSESEDSEEEEEYVLKGPWYELVRVDLAGLQAKYPDVTGWLYFENEKISYPIVKGTTNDTYLYTTYDGKSSKSGSIFMDVRSNPYFTDTHTIIYGHNMKNLSMFGKLKYYKNSSKYYKNHQYFQVFCGNEILRYQIFSYQEVPVDSYVYTESHSSASSLANRLKSTSMKDTGVTVSDGDRIITLSTCTSDDEYRFIVNAVLVDTYTLD